MSNETCRWVTARPLLFNDPGRGEVVSLPAGEPCSLLDSLEDARRRGLLPDESAVWAEPTCSAATAWSGCAAWCAGWPLTTLFRAGDDGDYRL